MIFTKLALGGNILIIPRQGEFWLVTSRLGTGKSVTFFLQCILNVATVGPPIKNHIF
jgi:hypothetical protein